MQKDYNCWTIAKTKIEPSDILRKKRKRRRFQRGLFFAVIAVLLLITYLIYHFWGEDVVRFITNPERVRAYVKENPVSSRIFFIAITFIRVVLAFIPGEPVEIGAGYAFGGFEGTVICVVGILLASVLIFKVVRRYGKPVVELFFTPEQIESVDFLNKPEKSTLIILIIFLVPGTPKDIVTYMASLTPINMKSWILITSIGRLPSIVTSTVGGSLLGSQKYIQAIIVFAITAVITLIGIIAYKRRTGKSKADSVKEA